jgi:hypothetical protein
MVRLDTMPSRRDDAAIEGFESQKRRIDEQIAELRAQSNGNAPAVVLAPLV